MKLADCFKAPEIKNSPSNFTSFAIKLSSTSIDAALKKLNSSPLRSTEPLNLQVCSCSETWAELKFQGKYCISLDYSEVFLSYFLDICGDEWWAEGE